MLKHILMSFLFIMGLSLNLSAQEVVYSAGIAAVDLEPEIGIPLAGYGSPLRRLPKLDWGNKYPHAFFFTPSTGFRDPVRSKTMVIHDSNGNKMVFISVDLVGVSKKVVKDLAKAFKKQGYKREHFFLSATHTHSGPGTISSNIGLSIIATDLYKKKNYKHIVGRAILSIQEAINNLEPVDLYHSEFDAVNVQHNKWRKSTPDYYNPQAKFILAKSRANGQWLGGMLNFAMHGNAMHIADTRFSGDVPGAMERAVERKIALKNDFISKKPIILFMNGAEGDVRHKGGRGEENMEAVAERFAKQAAFSALKDKNMTLVEPGMDIKTGRVFVGIPSYPLAACYERKGMMRTLLAILPDRIPLPLPLFPLYTKLTAAKLGQITLATWPGEASTTVGYNLENKAANVGHNKVWFLGLTNDYLTYFTTKSEFAEGEYDSCSSFYGYKGGRRIIKKLTKLMKKLD